MSMSGSTRTIKQTLETLRVLCPTQYPVRVRRTKLPDGIFGDADYISKGKRHFKIRLCSKLTPEFLVWVLVHEWAHCMTWDLTHSRHDDHGAYFGIAYSEAYQAIYS